MQIKPIRIGKITAPNNVFLAPMAGYTDYAFRTLVLSLGAGFCFTELVSAKGTVYKAGGTAFASRFFVRRRKKLISE